MNLNPFKKDPLDNLIYVDDDGSKLKVELPNISNENSNINLNNTGLLSKKYKATISLEACEFNDIILILYEAQKLNKQQQKINILQVDIN